MVASWWVHPVHEECGAQSGFDLYRKVVVDHNRNPCGTGRIADPHCTARVVNRLCGDQCEVFLRLDDASECIQQFTHDTDGCALCVASASMLAKTLPGLTPHGARELGEAFRGLIVHGSASDSLGQLATLAPVRRFPARHRCVLLPWEATMEALGAALKPASDLRDAPS